MVKIKRGKIITVTSMKGGVGKTINVLTLATKFKIMHKKVLVIDLDLYNGNIAFALDKSFKSSIYNLADDISNNRYTSDNINDYLIKYDDFIDILPAPKDPRQASKIEQRVLQTFIKNLSNKYDVILIDTNHILSVTNVIAFEISDYILNIFTNTAFDLKNTKNFVAVCKNMKVDNLLLMLNASVDDKKKTFTIEEIQTVLEEKINYIIPKSFFIKNIDQYIMDGKIMTIIEKILKNNSSELTEFTNFTLRLLDDKEGEQNEKK